MQIKASSRARDFIIERGAKIYVWSEHELSHAATEPPNASIEFLSFPADGFTFYQDATIGSPDWWKLEFHHLPHEHVTATWDGGMFGGGGEPVPY